MRAYQEELIRVVIGLEFQFKISSLNFQYSKNSIEKEKSH